MVIGQDFRLNVARNTEAGYGDGLANIVNLAAAILTGKGADVGSNFFSENRNPFPGAVAVDVNLPGSGSAEDMPFKDGEMDFVFCSHMLEHTGNPGQAVAEAWRVLREGGLYFLYLPFPGHPEWDPALCHAARGEHQWQPSPSSVGRLLLLYGFEVAYLEYEKDSLWSFIAIGRK